MMKRPPLPVRGVPVGRAHYRRVLVQGLCLVSRKTERVGPATHMRIRELDVIILPPTELANLIAARRLPEHQEAATGTGKKLGRHLRSNVKVSRAQWQGAARRTISDYAS